MAGSGKGLGMEGEDASWLTVRQVSTLWPGVASVHDTALANGVRCRTDSPVTPSGPPAVVRYHAGDVRRVAPLVTAAPRGSGRRTAVAGCLVLLGLLAGLVTLVLWAWCQRPGAEPGYWH